MSAAEGIITYVASAVVLGLVAFAAGQSGNAMARQAVFTDCAIHGSADLGEGRSIKCSLAAAAPPEGKEEK